MFCKVKNIFKNMPSYSQIDTSIMIESQTMSFDDVEFKANFIKIDSYSDLNLTGLC